MAPKKPATESTRRQPARPAKTAAKKAATEVITAPKKVAAKANTAKKRTTTKSAAKPAGVKKTTSPKKKATPTKKATASASGAGKRGRPAGSVKKTTTAKKPTPKKRASSTKVKEHLEAAAEDTKEAAKDALEVAGARSRSKSPAKATKPKK